MWLLSRQVTRGMREYVRSVDVLFLEPFQLETVLNKGSSIVSEKSEGKSETKSYVRGNRTRHGFD